MIPMPLIELETSTGVQLVPGFRVTFVYYAFGFDCFLSPLQNESTDSTVVTLGL